MTQPVQPRPQPVMDEVSPVGQLSASAVFAVGVVWFLVTGGVNSHNLLTVANAFGAAVTALAALGSWLYARSRARAAAARVTPTEAPMRLAPQTGQLVPLLTAREWEHEAATAGKHSEVHAEPPPPTTEPYARLRESADRPTPFRREDAPVTGIHAHPWKKLGKLAPIPGRAAVPFGKFLKAAPAHPIADPAPNLAYPMDENDRAGCCVVAGVDHTMQTVCAALGVQRANWTSDQILAYYRTQNPGMNSWADAGTSADGGMIVQTFLEYLVAQGVILAFGKIDHTNPDEMRAATWLGLAIVTGETLETAQQSQTVWDYQKSGDWGGHCTCTVGYPGATRQTCVSWGAERDMTEAFISHQLDEAWFVLTQAHVDHPAFRAGYDVAGFAAAVAELTNGKVVVPIPAPQPPPAPQPVPGPTPAPVVIPASLVEWAKHKLTLKGQTHADVTAAHEILRLAGQ